MKTKLKYCALAPIILLLAAALCACAGGRDAEGTATSASAAGGGALPSDISSPTENTPTIGGGLQTAAVIFDFSSGSPEENLRWETEYAYDDITLDDLVECLGSWSGLDFFAAVSFNDDGGAVVDWASNSTLIVGLDDRKQKEDFHFFDEDSLRWFMMDSMYRTLKENLYTDEIYYTADGGKELSFDSLYPANVFPSNVPYMGSAFYFAHAEGQGSLTRGGRRLLLWKNL